MLSPTSTFHNSPTQEAAASLPLSGEEIASHGGSSIREEIIVDNHVREAQERPGTSNEAVTSTQHSENSEDDGVIYDNKHSTCGPYITLKYFTARTPNSDEKKYRLSHQTSAVGKRKRPATREDPRFAKRHTSLATSGYKSVDDAASENLKRLETQNRRLLCANDQHKLQVTALQNQIQGLQQNNAQLEHEKQQLQGQLASASAATVEKSTSKRAHHSYTASQRAALNSLEAHRHLLPSQPASLPSPSPELSSSSTKSKSADVKAQLADKKEEIKTLRRQNEGLNIELVALQKDCQRLCHHNQELTNAVMRFATLEQIEWPKERMQMSTEVVAMRGRVNWLEREVARLNDLAHGVTGAGEFLRLWPEHGHPQQQVLDDGELDNFNTVQYGADPGLAELLSTPDPSESVLGIDAAKHGDKKLPREENLECPAQQRDEAIAD